jgi:hypothetical protein
MFGSKFVRMTVLAGALATGVGCGGAPEDEAMDLEVGTTSSGLVSSPDLNMEFMPSETCEPGNTCFDIVITNNSGIDQPSVYFGVDSVGAGVGWLVNPDPVPAGVEAAYGGRAMGAIEANKSSARMPLHFGGAMDPAAVAARVWGSVPGDVTRSFSGPTV